MGVPTRSDRCATAVACVKRESIALEARGGSRAVVRGVQRFGGEVAVFPLVRGVVCVAVDPERLQREEKCECKCCSCCCLLREELKKEDAGTAAKICAWASFQLEA